MKHSLRITMFLVLLFLAIQFFGLFTVNKHIEVSEDVTTGEVMVLHPATVIGEPPEVGNKSFSFLYIMIGVLLGTGLLLLMIKFNAQQGWKYWFLLSVVVTSAVALGVYIQSTLAFILALVFGWWKVFRPNIYVHNLTEVLIYTGIAVIFLPVLNLTSVFVLLGLISLYDMYAVWKSKHMITLAKFQTQSKVFAGLFIPYSNAKPLTAKQVRDAKKKGQKVIKKQVKNAILGGGDVAFPLLFASTVMEHIIINQGIAKMTALLYTLIIPVCTAIALFVLFMKAEKDKFYPAMPFVTAGCVAGFGIMWALI
jgi:presenilin-like A22 family membrane protease